MQYETKLDIKNFSDVMRVNAFANDPTRDFSMTMTDFRGSVADTRSLLGLMSLSFTEPVTIFCDQDGYIQKLVEMLHRV